MGGGGEGEGEANCPPHYCPSFGRFDSGLCLHLLLSLCLSFPWSLMISMPLSPRLSSSVLSGFPVPSCVGWVQEPRGERHIQCFSVHPPPHPTHPQQSSDPRPGRHMGRQRWGQGKLRESAWSLRRTVPALGASFRSHKGGNGSERGSGWSRSPGGEVGVGTRTRALATPGSHRTPSLGERLRSRQHWRHKETVRDAETEIQTDVETRERERERETQRDIYPDRRARETRVTETEKDRDI